MQAEVIEIEKKNSGKQRKSFIYNGFIPHPMNYHASCVFTVVFTVVFTACSMCVHCVFTANEFWAPSSSSSVCRGRRPSSSSFVGRSVDPFVGRRRRRPSFVVRRRRCRRSVGRSARSTYPCLSRQTGVSSPLTFVVANHTNFLPACFSSFIASLAPSLFVAYRRAALETRGATCPRGPPQEPP